MATKRAAAPAGAEDEPRETATQESVPLPANDEGDSVPEVQGQGTVTEGDSTAKRPAEEWVVYTDAQHFEERRITKADWAKVGLPDAPEVVWDRSNGHRVRKSALMEFLDEDQFHSFILADPRFELVVK